MSATPLNGLGGRTGDVQQLPEPVASSAARCCTGSDEAGRVGHGRARAITADGCRRPRLRRHQASLPLALLEQRPRLVAEALLPVVIEAAFAQLGAEAVGRGAIERKAFGLQVSLHRRVELGDVLALLHARVVDGVRHDGLEIGGQALPSAPFMMNQKPSQMWLVSEQYFCTS
jgi:hypothetical protein